MFKRIRNYVLTCLIAAGLGAHPLQPAFSQGLFSFQLGPQTVVGNARALAGPGQQIPLSTLTSLLTGSSISNTPVQGSLLVGTGAGTANWSKTITGADLYIWNSPTATSQPTVLYNDLTTAGAGWALQFWGEDSNQANNSIGASINGGFASRVPGALKGSLDLVAYNGAGSAVAHMAVTANTATPGLIPAVDNTQALGQPSQRFATLQTVLATIGTLTLTNPLSVANGGTGDTGSAWSTFTPAFSCGTATFTNNSSRFKTMGKTVWIEWDYTITAIGTCTNQINMTLPVTPQSPGAGAQLEFVVVGVIGTCRFIGGLSTAACSKFNPTVANFTVNERWTGSGVYESQ